VYRKQAFTGKNDNLDKTSYATKQFSPEQNGKKKCSDLFPSQKKRTSKPNKRKRIFGEKFMAEARSQSSPPSSAGELGLRGDMDNELLAWRPRVLQGA